MMADMRAPFRGLRGADPEELFRDLPTPCYIIDEAMLRRNGRILAGLAERTGCRILLAQKAFSNYDMYPVLEPYLAGTEASGLYEARLGAEEMPGREVHVFCAAYREDEFDELLEYADHIVFNSPYQLSFFGKKAKAAGKEIGLRINPECSTQDGHEIYDPCAPGSRLGTTRDQWDRLMTDDLVSMLDGLHFHTLCEQDSDALELTLGAVEDKFGNVLAGMKWLNMGGGHHITRDGYDMDRLEKCIGNVRKKWNLQVYLEPGEACALNSGYLLTTVLDVIRNGDTDLAVLAILLASFLVKTACGEMDLSGYVISLVEPYLNAAVLPAVVFIILAGLTFITSSFWGIEVISLPIVVPLAIALDGNILLVLSAVVSGGVFGSHACFYSDATVLSSATCEIDNMDHAVTQAPYAVMGAIISVVAYLIAGAVM